MFRCHAPATFAALHFLSAGKNCTNREGFTLPVGVDTLGSKERTATIVLKMHWLLSLCNLADFCLPCVCAYGKPFCPFVHHAFARKASVASTTARPVGLLSCQATFFFPSLWAPSCPNLSLACQSLQLNKFKRTGTLRITFLLDAP